MPTDAGYSQANLLSNAFIAAMGAINAANAVGDYRKLHRITQRLVDIEEAQQALLKENYWPAETAHVEEFVQPQTWDSVPVLAARYEGRLWPPMAGVFARRRQQLECSAPRHCGPAAQRKLMQLRVEEAGARATVHLLARRIAYEEVKAVTDTDFDRRKQAVAIRQDLVGQAVALMAAASRGYAGAAAVSMAGANSASEALGYLTTRIFNRDQGAPVLQGQAARTTVDPAAPLEAAPLPTLDSFDLSAGLPSAAVDTQTQRDTADYGGSV